MMMNIPVEMMVMEGEEQGDTLEGGDTLWDTPDPMEDTPGMTGD